MASTATASIPRLIEAVNEHMEALNYVEDPRRVAGHTILAVTTLLEVVEKQEERNQKIAAALDELAEAIHYPTSSVRELRAKVRAIARIARGEQSQEGR